MAFWDFMDEPVGGPETAPSAVSQPGLSSWQGGDYGSSFAPAEPAATSQSPIKQMTWGELLKALAQTSGPYQAPGGGFGSPQMLGQGQGQGGVYPIGPTQDFSQPKEKANTSAGDAMSIMSMFGV